jgi:hypothetical protein
MAGEIWRHGCVVLHARGTMMIGQMKELAEENRRLKKIYA